MTLKAMMIWAITLGLLASGCGSTADQTSTTPATSTPQDITTANASANTSSPDPETAMTPESKEPSDVNTTLVHHQYASSDHMVLNPERGYFYWTDLLDNDYSNARDLGYTLIYARVFLKEYVGKPLDDVILTKIDAAFQRVRKAGIKCILRFTYSDAIEKDTDASLALILQHISQLKPLLTAHADVIHVMQAGFIGRWGEWHSSSNGLDNNPSAQKQILNAILEALPSRHVLVRTPMFKNDYELIAGNAENRVGHHNDCFLASPTDFGTYPDDAIDFWKSIIATDGMATSVGGETCWLNSPRSDCETAIGELSALHFSFLNGSTGDGVTSAWKAQGCYNEIGRKLGYRLNLIDSEMNERIRPGGIFHIRLTLKNDGFAPLYYPRDVYLRLVGSTTYIAKLNVNWNQLTPGATYSVEANIALPQETSEGIYKLSVWLPDRASTIRHNPHYDLHLANLDDNLLTNTIVIDHNASTYSAESNTSFEPQ